MYDPVTVPEFVQIEQELAIGDAVRRPIAAVADDDRDISQTTNGSTTSELFSSNCALASVLQPCSFCALNLHEGIEGARPGGLEQSGHEDRAV